MAYQEKRLITSRTHDFQNHIRPRTSRALRCGNGCIGRASSTPICLGIVMVFTTSSLQGWIRWMAARYHWLGPRTSDESAPAPLRRYLGSFLSLSYLQEALDSSEGAFVAQYCTKETGINCKLLYSCRLYRRSLSFRK